MVIPEHFLAGTESNPYEPTNFYAVRRAKSGIRSCVFLNWEECKKHVEGYDRADFAIYDTVEEAVRYIWPGDKQYDSDQEIDLKKDRQKDNLKDDSSLISKDYCKEGNEANSSRCSRILMPRVKNRRGKSHGLKAQSNPNRKPTKAWNKMYESLKAYKAEKGCLKINSNDKDYADLLRWMRQQQHEYRYLKEGRPSSMFQTKIDKLQEIGFEFKFVSTEDMMNAMLQYSEENGNYDIPLDHPILGKWVENQKKVAKKFASGDPSAYFEHKVQELKSLGLLNEMESNKSKTIDEDLEKEENRKWNESFEQLKVYKDKNNGSCEVPPSLHTSLSHWCTKQQIEYQKVKEGKASKLTVGRLQRLNDVGFVFRQMGKTFSWEERIEQLRKYKELNGHTRVPKSDPELGVFVNRQRYEYSKYMDGRPSTMNEKRIKDLTALDFVFVAGKKMSHVDFKNKKTWEERYTELLQFREIYGHSIVPQSFPGLGEWVHTQRMYYKRLKKGKQSPLTAERVLKLADVGFLFDATKRRGGSASDDEEGRL